MSVDWYELLALLMRYIFVVIGVLILWRAFRWLRKDARAYKKEMRSLPDAGLIGEVVDLATGKSQPLPREGTMGSSRFCDIRIKGAGVRRCHALFALEEGKGLQIIPQRSRVIMAGVELRGPAHALHGTELQLGNAVVKVRLFAGLKVPHPSQFQLDQPMYEQEADAPWLEEMEDVPPPFGMMYANEEEEFQAQEAYQSYQNDAPQEQYAPPQAPYEAYPQQGQQWQPAPEYSLDDQEEDEAIPYQSPLPRRRRRSSR